MPAIDLNVNDTNHRVDSRAERPLLSVLRDDLDLTGAKYGCGEGRCGACTVMIDGKAVRSCVTSVGDCAGRPITTIEGLTTGDRLHPLQQKFLETGALQCGYCTPGMIVAAAALLKKNPSPTPEEVARGLEGNICRCGAYGRIVTAVCRAAEEMRKGGAQ